MEAQAQMKYHHSERCFTYRMKRPMVSCSLGCTPSWIGNGIPAVTAELGRPQKAPCSSKRREDPSVVNSEPTYRGPPRIGSLVSRHLPDREFGWGGISVTRQRRCPKASSVGTEISRRTQA